MTNSSSLNVDCVASFLTDQVLDLLVIINLVILNGVIGSIGLLANVIKVIVFFKAGFSDSTNISFFVLSVAETGVVLVLVAFSLVYNPAILQDLDYLELVALMGWSYGFFSRVASLMTAEITVERYLCIAFPLKVKFIASPTASAVIATTIVCSVLATVAPAYKAFSYGDVFNEKLNKTMRRLVSTDTRLSLENITSSSLVSFQLAALGIIITFTAALIRTFLRLTKWRNEVSSTRASLSCREKKLVKMLIFISISFLAFSSPALISLMMMLSNHEFSVYGRCRNLFFVIYSFIFPTDGINSIVSFVIFVRMSSKFRNLTKAMFCIDSSFDKKKKGRGKKTRDLGK